MKPSGIGVQNRESSSELDSVDITEKGRSASGEVITSTRRLYMQLLAFGDVKDTQALIWALESARIEGALYEDINDPRGVAIVTYSESPDFFVDDLRDFHSRVSEATISETTYPAPQRRHICRKGPSVTPAIGARAMGVSSV